MSPSRFLIVGIVGAAVGLITAACNAGFYQGPDRPEDPEVEGPPPPAVFHCQEGARRRVEKSDAGAHRLFYVMGNGEVVCSTVDTDNDGKIDSWVKLDHGRVVSTRSVAAGAPGDAGVRSPDGGSKKP